MFAVAGYENMLCSRQRLEPVEKIGIIVRVEFVLDRVSGADKHIGAVRDE